MQMTETFHAQILAQIDQLQAQVKSARTYAALDFWGGKAFFSAIKRQKMRAIQEELTQLAHLLEQVPGLDLPQELATFDAKSGQIWDIVLDNVWTDAKVQAQLKCLDQALVQLKHVINKNPS